MLKFTVFVCWNVPLISALPNNYIFVDFVNDPFGFGHFYVMDNLATNCHIYFFRLVCSEIFHFGFNLIVYYSLTLFRLPFFFSFFSEIIHTNNPNDLIKPQNQIFSFAFWIKSSLNCIIVRIAERKIYLIIMFVFLYILQVCHQRRYVMLVFRWIHRQCVAVNMPHSYALMIWKVHHCIR